MSLFSWFTSKKHDESVTAVDHDGETLPLMPSDGHRDKPTHPVVQTENRKIERLENRESIYSVVRDAMIRAGVLAASYKFKVLSLDAHGLQYLIMMDLTNKTVGDYARLTEIEVMIAQAAKLRHNITVTAVYWRMTEQVTAGTGVKPSKPAPASPEKAPELPASRPAAAPQMPKYEPLQEDEVAAFKRALATVTPAAARWASGQIVTSGRRNPSPPVDFQDTQRAETGERASPLSVTQYGDLN